MKYEHCTVNDEHFCGKDVQRSLFNVHLAITEEEGFVVPVGIDSRQLIDFVIGNFCKIGSKRELWQL